MDHESAIKYYCYYYNVNKFRIPTTKHFFKLKGGRCETFDGVNFVQCSSLMLNAEKWGANIKKWGRCQLVLPNFMCCQTCLPNFSVFKVVYHEHPFAFSSSAISVMP